MLYAIILSVGAGIAWSKFGPDKYRHIPSLIWWTFRWDRSARPAVIFLILLIGFMTIQGGNKVAPAPAPAPAVTSAAPVGQQAGQQQSDYCMTPDGGPAAIQALRGRYACDKDGKPLHAAPQPDKK